MTDPKNESTPDTTTEELNLLKERAKIMGISFSPNIGLDALRKKVNTKIAGDKNEAEVPVETPEEETVQQKRKRLYMDANRLVRVQITCLNPLKKDYDGEIKTVGNGFLGTFKKYIAFNVPWYVPKIILDTMETSKCQTFHTIVDHRGRKVRQGKQIQEYGIHYLPDMTEEEFKALAQQQAMQRGTAVGA